MSNETSVVGDVDAATRAHFTARAASYAGAGDISLQAMLELAQLRPGERALDVATGTGAVLFALAEAVAPGGIAAGIDFTPAMLAQAAQRRVRRASEGDQKTRDVQAALIAAHASRLPFKAGRFDVATCRMSVHHMADPAAGLAAMAGVLRPGGRLVICDFVAPADQAAAARHDRLERLRGHQYVQIYTATRLEALMAAAGCPVTARRMVAREMDPQEWLRIPTLSDDARRELATLVVEVTGGADAGFTVRQPDQQPGAGARLVREDAVLVGMLMGANA